MSLVFVIEGRFVRGAGLQARRVRLLVALWPVRNRTLLEGPTSTKQAQETLRP